MTDKLLQRLKDLILNCTNEPSKKDLAAAVTRVYKDKAVAAKEEKKQSDDKPKRKPSVYNIFYKEQSAVLRAKEESVPKEERMSAKEKMAHIASLWKAQKEQAAGGEAEEEAFSDAPEDAPEDQGSEADEEEPVKPPPKGKKEEKKDKKEEKKDKKEKEDKKEKKDKKEKDDGQAKKSKKHPKKDDE